MTRVAVVQAGSVAFDTAATLERFEMLLDDAAADEVALAVFPEAFVGGYPKGHGFGTVVGSRSEEGHDWFARYHAGAIDVPGPETDHLAALCAERGIEAVVGVIERAGGTLYCTALLIGSDGTLRGKHRKLMPTAAERLIWGFGDGSTMPVAATPVGNVGAAICWENYMPLYRTTLYAKGIELWAAPTVDDRERWRVTMRHIAVEGRCFVLSACQYTTRSDYPADYPVDLDGPLIAGGSCIVAPDGELLAGPLRDGPGILSADIDLTDIARARFDFDATGHYARLDVFSLHVDESRHDPVVFDPER